MHVRSYCISLLYLILSCIGWAHADTIVHNASIYTQDAKKSLPQAFAYSREGIIIAVGDLLKLQEQFPNASLLDLKKNTVLPGFIDAHGHLFNFGISELNAKVFTTRSAQEVIDILKEYEKKLPPNAWLIGRGWDQNSWQNVAFPNKEQLDAVFPNRPVWLTRVDGHAAWANSAAIHASTKDFSGDWQVEGGQIVREKGEPTGIFIDNAMPLIADLIPKADDAYLLKALQVAVSRANSLGITGVHEAGMSWQRVSIVKSAIDTAQLPLRIYAMANGAGDTMQRLCTEGPIIDYGNKLTVRSVKFYSDGALGSRGAALFDDYTDDAGNLGTMFNSQQQLESLFTQAMACDLQVNTHAIGDRATSIVLDAYAASIKNKSLHGRHRIEHAQIVKLSDIPRFKQLGIIASMQTSHAISDMRWAGDRLGQSRLAGAYAWQSMIDANVPLALGSDFPNDEMSPLHGIYAAVTRQNVQGQPADGWTAAQRISRQAAVYGYTQGAAYAAFQEKQLGSLEVGKRADFVVLSKNIMTVPSREILNTHVLATYLDGKRVFTHQQFNQ